MSDGVDAAVTTVAREDGGRIVAILASRFHDVALADDAVQDALVEALSSWRRDGIPTNPGAWLLTVARNRAVDRIRRSQSAERRLLAAAPELTAPPPEQEEALIVDELAVHDEQLRLVLLCCHPALDRDAQVALTLKLVGGLTTAEIAAAFVVPEATLAQRIVRAKRKIRDAGIPLTIPADLGTRIGVVLTVLYLVFNEGYLSRGGSAVQRLDLADEAIRLTERFQGLVPESAETLGLLALQRFHHARAASRVDPSGDLVLLEDQDRSRWELPAIEQANHELGRALALGELGRYQVQALIAAVHANARTAAETDWPAIVRYYDLLLAMRPSAVVALNRAVAVTMADGPRAGLRELDSVIGLDGYHLLWSTRGMLLARIGDRDAAKVALEHALTLTANPAERRLLRRRIDADGS